MRRSTSRGPGVSGAMAGSCTHSGRLKLFQTRLPPWVPVPWTRWPSTYTATLPMVCQRGRYSASAVSCSLSKASGTGSRYHTTCGWAVSDPPGSATERGRAWGRATDSPAVTSSSPRGTMAGASQPPPGWCSSTASPMRRSGRGGWARAGATASSSHKPSQSTSATASIQGRKPFVEGLAAGCPCRCASRMASARVFTSSLA